MIRHRFSIVIPTRNRSTTLKYTLETCLNQILFDDYEIIVNDNSDGEASERMLNEVVSANPRASNIIKYHRRDAICCMTANFEDAIQRASGYYIIVLGDDDGILPMALYEIDRLIAAEDIGIVKWNNGTYNWPEMASQVSANYLGFSLARWSEATDGRTALRACIARQNYETLPMLYINAAIRFDLIDAIKDSTGRLFLSQSPDVYSGILLSYKCDKFINVSVPFTIAGLSQYSNGVASGFDGTNTTPRLEFRALNAAAGIFQHPAVPDLSIFPTVAFADSFYVAKQSHFPQDSSIDLPRRQLMEACVARANTTTEAVRRELIRVCEDDPELAAYTRDLIADKTETLPPLRLKPVHLGFDGENVHLDPREHGVTTIAGAVALVHKIIWPNDAPLRYDLPGATEIRDLRATLNRRGAELTQRSADLEAALAELPELRAALAERSASLEATLSDVQAVRDTLIDRTIRLEASITECDALRSRLATRI